MTEGSTLEKSQHSRLWLTSLATGVGLSVLMLLGATGCDTVAQFSFSDREFQSIKPISFSPTGGSCQGVSDAATMRMVLMANDATPVKPGGELSLATVDLTANDITFTNGRLFSFEDVTCGGDDGLTCSMGMTCTPPPEDVAALGNRCSRTTPIGVLGQPRYVGESPASQALAVVMSNEGRWGGWLPPDVAALFPVDESGSPIGQPGTPTGDRDTGASNNAGRAGDLTNSRTGAVVELVDEWELLSNYVQGDERDALFALWTFSQSSAATTSWVGALSAENNPWTRQPERAKSAVDGFREIRAAQGDRAYVYSNMLDILNQGFAPPTHDGDKPWYSAVMEGVEDKAIILVVGGHDERRLPTQGVDSVIDRANELGVTVHVVQADPPVADVTLLRDDFIYYEQQTGCESDSECKNFEECRTPQFYCNAASRSNCNSVAHPGDTSQQYCMPKRDENGRLGPIHEYQQLACATGGSYSYLPVMTSGLLSNRIEGIPFSAEAAWEVDLAVDEAATLGSGVPFSLGGYLEINQGKTAIYNFSQAGLTGGNAAVPESRDTRPVLFSDGPAGDGGD